MGTKRSKKSAADGQDARRPNNAIIGDVVEDAFTGLILSRKKETGGHLVTERVIHVKDLSGGGLAALKDLDEVSLPKSPQVERLRLRKDDILISARGQFKVGMVREAQAGAIAGPNLLVFRPGDQLKGPLLFAYLRHPNTEAILQRLSVGTTVPSLSLSSIRGFPVRVPTTEEQHRLSRLVELGEVQYSAAVEAAEKRRVLATELAAEALRS